MVGSPNWLLPAPTPEQIWGYRISTGLGVRALCARHGINESTWSAWESGYRRMPRITWTYLAIVDGLHPDVVLKGRPVDPEHWETVGERGDAQSIALWQCCKDRHYPAWAKELVAGDAEALERLEARIQQETGIAVDRVAPPQGGRKHVGVEPEPE